MQHLYDYEADAQRVYDVLADGGIGIIPSDVGYVILGITKQAIEGIFKAKKRKPEKLNAMIGCKPMHYVLHDVSPEKRQVVSAVTESANLPMGTVGPARLEHPMLAHLDPAVLDQTTKDGTIAMLLNAGPLMDAMAHIALDHHTPVIGSSANVSLHGVKFRVEDIEPEIIDAADIVIDYGLMRWHSYGKSSTMINFADYSVVRYGSCFDLIDDVLRRHFDIALLPEPSA